MSAPIKDIGCANEWGRAAPPEYQTHLAKIQAGEQHQVEEKLIGRCYHRTTCLTCGITWTVDSSD